MSACDTCPKPGACCQNFPLNYQGDLPTRLDALIFAAGMVYEAPDKHRTFVGLPFVPTDRGADGRWRWSCVDLLPNGRCGNYENRPYGPCVIYKPGSTTLCVLYDGSEEARSAARLKTWIDEALGRQT